MAVTTYKTIAGDRWDTVAYKAYGDAFLGSMLMDANPDIPIDSELPAGVTLYVPIYTNPVTNTQLPPWATDEEDNTDDPEIVTPGIPVVPAPEVALAFSANYPKVNGNRIEFAINRAGMYPYSVEKVTGGAVFSSPGYQFTPGFPVQTGDIVDGGYYRVRVGTIVSGQLTIVGQTPIAFVQQPTIVKMGSSWLLKFSINKTGSYRTKITDFSDNTLTYNQDVNYTSGFVVSLPVAELGNYKLEVGTLVYNFSVTDVTESTDTPAWLTNAGYRYDANSHDFTLQLGATANVEVNVTAVVGANPSGKDQDNNPWNSGVYNPGKNDYVTAPYTERFSFNPLTAATGGLNPNTQYRFRIRRSSTPDDIFVLFFTTPSVTSPAGDPVVIDLDTPSSACPIPPTIQSIVQADSDNVTFLQAAGGVKSDIWQVLDSTDAVVRSGLVVIFDEAGQPVFSPSNQITVNFTPLVDGTYTFRVRGGNCTSDWSEANFTVSDGYVPGEEELEIVAYFTDEGTADCKILIAGTAPYDISVLDDLDYEVYAITSTSDETELPDSVIAALAGSGIKIIASDATSKAGTRSYTGPELEVIKIWHAGFSVANGNVSDHVIGINNGDGKHFTHTGIMYTSPDTDAQFIVMESGTRVAGGGSSFAIDNVIDLAKGKTYAKRLRLGINLCRDSNKLNNGTSRTVFYGTGALAKRVDGVTPICLLATGDGPPSIAVPSPSSTEFRTFAKRYVLGIIKRNLIDFNDCTIPWAALIIGASGESEYTSYLRDAGGADGAESPGDFHPECIASFKNRFPEHESVTNAQIASVFKTNVPLDLAWREHLALELKECFEEIWDYAYANCAGWERNSVEQIDCGSFVDDQAKLRQSLNFKARIRKQTFLLKSNDNSNLSPDRISFICDHISSHRIPCMIEPSPPGSFGDPTNRGYVVAELNQMYARGIWWSDVDASTSNAQYFLDNSDVVPGALSQAKQSFTISGANKFLKRLIRNISEVFKTGGFGGWEDAWAAFRTAESLTHVDTLSYDDLKPVSNPDPGPDPPTPGTGVYSPVIRHYGLASLLNVNVTGNAGSTSEDWRITLTSSETPGSGYQWWVWFDENLIKGSGLPVNYVYQSNEPLYVMAIIVKTGTTTLYKWANSNEGAYIPGFSDPNAGQTMALNSSGATVEIGFQEV